MDKNLSQTLDLLRQESDTIPYPVFGGLSDLSRSDMALLQAAWSHWSLTRRQKLIQAVNVRARARVELDYTMILLWTLADADPTVRRLSIEGLREDDDESLIPLFVQALQTDPDAEVRAAAAKALGQFVLLGEYEEIAVANAGGVLPALLATVASASELLSVRRQAVEAVGYASDQRARAVIEDAYRDEDEAMQASALRAMGNSADRHWNKTVRDALDSHSHVKRLAAVYAAGELEIQAAAPRLIILLDDPDPAMRRAAVTALGTVGGPLARPALQAVFRAEDDDLELLAADALETLDFNSQGLTGADDEFGDELDDEIDDEKEDDEDDDQDVADDDFDD
ncbi:MAG: HEAT repeat domain-containing protein [Anaerolineae bacterium]